MPSPVRYPNGVTNVSNNDPLRDFIRDDVARWTRLVEAVGLEKLRDGAAR